MCLYQICNFTILMFICIQFLTKPDKKLYYSGTKQLNTHCTWTYVCRCIVHTLYNKLV